METLSTECSRSEAIPHGIIAIPHPNLPTHHRLSRCLTGMMIDLLEEGQSDPPSFSDLIAGNKSDYQQSS
jgi:hypothetical protein